MLVVRCPDKYKHGTSVFLAGGITGCPDWQELIIQLLQDCPGTLLCPRREVYQPSGDSRQDWYDLEKEQVQWEHEHLMLADAHAFFFPPDTLCPVTLFELGKVSGQRKPLFVAIDPKYKKRDNVEIQLSHVRPDVTVVQEVEQLAHGLSKWYSKRVMI